MDKPNRQPWYRRIGPGLITACVVIGPGSVLTSSQVGAAEGFSRNWIVVVAVLCMMVYTSLGAKLGAATGESPGSLISAGAGRPLAVLIGISIFFISALFQFGNNLGAQAALEAFVHVGDWQTAFHVALLLLLNGLSLAFLFGFRDLYKALERLMSAFVAVMLLCFAANLALARPNLTALLSGFVPRWSSDLDISVLGLIGTTFVISAAYLQSYLVQQRGWGKADVKQGLTDARVGAVIMFLITLMILSTSAAVFYRPGQQPTEFEGVGEVAQQLRPLLKDWGNFVFCLGLFCAAYSSFLVNAMVGGFILSDGLGLGSKPDHPWPRYCTAAVLMVGMAVALGVIVMDFNPVPAIIMAQALTVIAAPLLAGVMIWLTNRRDVMGEDRNRILTNLGAAAGFLLLLAMAFRTAVFVIPEKYDQWRNPTPPAAAVEHIARPVPTTIAAPHSILGYLQARQARRGPTKTRPTVFSGRTLDIALSQARFDPFRRGAVAAFPLKVNVRIRIRRDNEGHLNQLRHDVGYDRLPRTSNREVSFIRRPQTAILQEVNAAIYRRQARQRRARR